MAQKCCRRKTINKKFVIMSSGIFLVSLIGSFLGGTWSNPDESVITDAASSLKQSTEKLAQSIGIIVPIVDAVDENVKTLSKKVDELEIPTVGMDKLMESISRLEQKVTGIDSKLDKSQTRILTPSTDTTLLIQDGDGSQPEPEKRFNAEEARRVLCVNRSTQTRCIPAVDAETPEVRRGFVKECLFYDGNLECGPMRPFN